jgi:hypothetical protein
MNTPSKRMGRKWIWLRRIAITTGILLVLVVAFVALVLYEISRPRETKLGGAWIISEPQSVIIESGIKPRFLERVHGHKRVTIARQPSSPQYIGDDCVLFAVLVLTRADLQHPEYRYEVKAACGDQQPITVARLADFPGELHQDPIRINRREISWAEIKEYARRGQSFPE